MSAYKKVFITAGYIILACAGAYVFFKLLLPLLLPFILAYAISALLKPAAGVLKRRTKLPGKVIGVFLLVVVLGLICVVIWLLAARVMFEIRSFVNSVTGDYDRIISAVYGFFEKAAEKFPFLSAFEDEQSAAVVTDALVSIMISSAASSLSGWLTSGAGRIIASLPDALLFAAVFLISAFYLCADISGVNAFIWAQLSESVRGFLIKAKTGLTGTGGKYFRAYVLILAVTFSELAVGFALLKLPYALSAAAVIAVLDLLPVIGVGTVLIPWAAVLLVTGDIYTGVGLLIIYAAVTVVRQIIEPRIVGSFIGLPPLAALIAMYGGYRLFGFGGMILAPLLFMLLKNLNDSGALPLWKTPDKKTEGNDKKAE